MWLWLLSEPLLTSPKVVWPEPSPQFTSTDHGPSVPGSLNEPSEKDFEVPSSAGWSPAAVTVGATLWTVTGTVTTLESTAGELPSPVSLTLNLKRSSPAKLESGMYVTSAGLPVNVSFVCSTMP